MKFSPYILILISIFFTVSCDNHDETNGLESSTQTNDIVINSISISGDGKWAEFEKPYSLTIDEIKFSSKNASLYAIQAVSSDKSIIGKTFYNDGCVLDIDTKVLSHGQNSIKIIGIFSTDDKLFEKEITTLRVTCFNEIPKIRFGLDIYLSGTYISSAGEIFDIGRPYTSDNQYLEFNFNFISICPLSGEVFDGNYDINLYLYPQIIKDQTNFEAKLDYDGIKWESLENPSTMDPYKTPLIGMNVKAFVEATITGVHEGIEISQKMNIGYVITNTYEDK